MTRATSVAEGHDVEVQQGFRARPVVQERDPVVRHRIWESDMQVQSHRSGNLVGEEAAQGTARRVGSTDQLGFVPAQRDPVVSVPGPRWPRRLLGREHRRKPRRVGDIPHGWRWFQHTQSGLVAQQLPDGHIALAGLCELRPVVDYFVVVAGTIRATPPTQRPGRQRLWWVENMLTMVSCCHGALVTPSR